ncbi:polysaccharide biosynthesis tyrosine autokinase [Subsaxibacter sp. CAU 1640]|uniref:GumC family protein n=1 Tax=Subsaxibacter sp. CAU 1640 TaxID=2933271 RepID=UPI002002C8FE|nr:polysaccharide biosynthesis tyrosine autokinase [Subsaxibacter sp. CAU 1640]MCK7591044.1 polysaccharide biosynthesis tyrosine autokinase [Subsaxibacter sp. CAU 1640]
MIQSPQNKNNKETIINIFELYLSKWKLIVFCLLIALGIAFLKIRYSTYEYQANASIKLKQDENSKKLSEISAIQNYGIFANDYSKVIDEVEILKSRSIIKQVAQDLKLNIQYFVSGKVKLQEVYVDPPVNINFYAKDSVVNQYNQSIFIKIVSDNQYELSKINNNKILEFEKGETSLHNFGEKTRTDFGDFVLTPNPGTYGSSVGSYIEIKLIPLNSIVERYLGKIKVEMSKESNVIKLSLNEEIKEKARLILDKLIEKYNQDVINDKEEVIKITSDFITNRLEVVSNELEQVDFTAETLQKNNRLTALASQSNIYLESERQNENKIIETANQLQLVDYMKDHLSEHSKPSDLLPADVGIADNSVSQITNTHNELVLQRNRLIKNSSEKNPTIVNLDNQINALKENLNQSLSNIRTANNITLNTLNREDARISGQIYSAPTKERQFRDIKRQQDIKESLYLYLLQKREETAISLGMSSSNAKIIDQAYTLDGPVSPNPKIIYLAAIILGLFIPISLIYARDLIDNKIHSKDDLIKYISAPYIGDIPKSSNKTRLIKKVDYSPKAEAFRIIRTNAEFMMQDVDKACKTIFVTSTTSQEGKSHTSINLATSFSFSEKRVLLIETDIRVPRVNDYLNIDSKKGLTDFISDKTLGIEDVTTKLEDNPYLDIIPSGTIPPNPAELLMSDRVKYLFEHVKKDYDYIIVDTAAVGLVTDTLLISKFADLFLYVVSANNIDKRQLHIAQTMYTEKRLPNMAILLNGTEHKKGYGYGYGKAPKKKKGWFKKS